MFVDVTEPSIWNESPTCTKPLLYEAITFYIPIFTFHFVFYFLLSAYFTGAVVLSILAGAYSILAVVLYSLAVVLSTLT